MVKLKGRFFILVTMAFLQTGLYAQNISIVDFKNPPNQFRPVPFWHLNGKLTSAEINRQVADAVRSGFGGVTVLPVTANPQYPTNLPSPGMSPEYLSDAYFSRYHDILKAARSNKANVILYDDIDFPSGSAGGKLQQDYPGATRKILTKTDTVVTGGSRFEMILPKGILMAVVGINLADSERIDLTSFAKDHRFIWQVPDGKWKVQVFNCELNEDKIVDYMDPGAVSKFINFTYDAYAKKFGSYFGNVIQRTFFDDVGYVTMERGWTAAFNKKFIQRFGRDPRIYYPALWQDIGPDTEAARVAFYDTRAELLAEGFPKLVTEWAHRHKVKTAGHPPGNYEIQPVDMNFDIFKFYRHQDIPTMDAIFYHGHGREGFKLASSAAAAYDKPIVAAEIYGAFLEDKFTVTTLYQAAMEVFARGVNFLIPHGMWYDTATQSVRIPPLISPYSKKIGPALRDFNDFAARTSMMLTGGRQVAEIGVLYPIASLEGFYHFQDKNNTGWGKYVPPGTDYLITSDLLTNNIHQDFTFIHPELLATDQYKIIGREIILDNKINKQHYKVIILPAGKVISYHTLKKIKQYYDQGGKVIATTLLPSKSAEFGMDAEVQRIVKEIFAPGKLSTDSATITNTNHNNGMALFILKTGEVSLSAALEKVNPYPDIKFEKNISSDSSSGAFSYIHKIKDGKNIYYFANSMEKEINTIVHLRGSIQAALWDPATGKKELVKDLAYKKIDGIIYTTIKLHLKPVQSLFIVER
ncbi:MAG: glycosyl hydrolase [Ferruginibacter sp.]